jgi:nitrogen fixation NifU-like protein
VSDLGRLYQESILLHHRAPRHFGRLDQPTHAADGNNPLCGDRVRVTLDIGEGRVLDVRCDVQGCAICRASGSMMAEAIVGRDLGEVKALLERFLAELSAAPSTEAGGAGDPASDPARWGPLAALLEARRFPNRRRCASLGWEVLQRALSDRAPGSGLQVPGGSERVPVGPAEVSASPEPDLEVPTPKPEA